MSTKTLTANAVFDALQLLFGQRLSSIAGAMFVVTLCDAHDRKARRKRASDRLWVVVAIRAETPSEAIAKMTRAADFAKIPRPFIVSIQHETIDNPEFIYTTL